jgi:hypothetical protein
MSKAKVNTIMSKKVKNIDIHENISPASSRAYEIS